MQPLFTSNLPNFSPTATYLASPVCYFLELSLSHAVATTGTFLQNYDLNLNLLMYILCCITWATRYLGSLSAWACLITFGCNALNCYFIAKSQSGIYTLDLLSTADLSTNILFLTNTLLFGSRKLEDPCLLAKEAGFVCRHECNLYTVSKLKTSQREWRRNAVTMP